MFIEQRASIEIITMAVDLVAPHQVRATFHPNHLAIGQARVAKVHFPAREEWLHNAVEQLLLGCDVKFQRRMRKAQGVTVAELEAAVDEYANGRLADGEVMTPSLGRLLIENSAGRADKAATAELLGSSDHPRRHQLRPARRL